MFFSRHFRCHGRRQTLALALALACLGGLLASAAQAQTKWDLPAAYAASNFHTENLVQFAADVDIDEAAGIEHGVEVIRNKLFNNRTSPYLIREFLLAANPGERTLDPGYDFVF